MTFHNRSGNVESQTGTGFFLGTEEHIKNPDESCFRDTACVVPEPYDNVLAFSTDADTEVPLLERDIRFRQFIQGIVDNHHPDLLDSLPENGSRKDLLVAVEKHVEKTAIQINRRNVFRPVVDEPVCVDKRIINVRRHHRFLRVAAQFLH